MIIFRFKILVLSIIAVAASSFFVLYKVDLYNKQKDIEFIKNQVQATAQSAYNIAVEDGGFNAHTYEILNAVKSQRGVQDLWVSRSDKLSNDITRPKSTLRDQIEGNVYITKQIEESLVRRNDNSNNVDARVSFPIIATEKCLACHPTIEKGDVLGAINLSIFLKDNILDIVYSMEQEFILFLAVASLLMMVMMMVSISSFTTVMDSIKTAVTSAINGDFALRVKSRMIATDEISKIINRLLEALDRSLTSIDTKLGTIFIYNRSLYNKNPLFRLTEVINEVTNLFTFRNKIDSFKQPSEIYREIQNIIQKYIHYKYYVFAELVGGEITSGYKVENDTNIKITAGEVTSIEKRLSDPKRNVIYNDDRGSVFISTSNGALNVIDIQCTIAENVMIYCSIGLESKRELAEKEKSVTRIYNYLREARHIINAKLLLKKIEESSYTDALSGAFNRFFLDKYSPTIKEKLANRVNFGVLMLDIDHFKLVNDTYGHAVGDAGIVLLTETIRKLLKPTDKLIRYGGEEFVVILEGADFGEAKRIAEKIRAAFAMAKKCSRGNLDFPKSVSIGVSAMPDFSTDVWECINQADLALYEAKEGGRNQVVPYSADVKARSEMKNAEKAQAEAAKQAEQEQNRAQALAQDAQESSGGDDEFLESLKLNNML